MNTRWKRLVGTSAAMAAAAAASQALAWGSSGHRIIGEAAIETLPPDVPAFLRTPEAAVAVGELSREPDRSKGAGHAHDADRDPGHYVNTDDDGRIAGGPQLTDLPSTREAYEKALTAQGSDSWRVGYLPYSIVEDWQQLVLDFAYWRADAAGAGHAKDPDHKAWLEADRARRESQILIDIGLLSHFVGDGSQPLHVSIHYNGWGPYPNPNGYTQSKVHSPWEGPYVRKVVTLAATKAAMAPAPDCGCPIGERVGAYLATTVKTVPTFYELEKAGAFKPGVVAGIDFTTARIAAGADELRDEIALAWRSSGDSRIGYRPEIAVSDVESGKIDPFDSLYGGD
jgi:hypothetical protein